MHAFLSLPQPSSMHHVINDTWTTKDMIEFNRQLTDEREVRCQWVDHGTCNDIAKGELHGPLISQSRGHVRYSCRWDECPSAPMKKSSLGRHTTEQHVPVKWFCPHCPPRFTRESILIEHLGRIHGEA
ncbi:hypothetical protein J3R82DRAFT_1568 [Butyriboletus roseoflavus]|nr:hypothetical protein J3R82DRAFT_1568 [Butyriboletus roseoflavus]